MNFSFPAPHAHQKNNQFGASVFTASNPLMNLPGRIAPTITRADGTPAIRSKTSSVQRSRYEENRKALSSRLHDTMLRTHSTKKSSLSQSNRMASTSLMSLQGASSTMSLQESGRFVGRSNPYANSRPRKPHRKFKGRACTATIEAHAKMGLWSSFTTAATPWQIAPPVNEEDERAKRARALNMVGILQVKPLSHQNVHLPYSHFASSVYRQVAASMAGNESRASGRLKATRSSADFGGIAVQLASESFDRRLAISRERQRLRAAEPSTEMTAVELHEASNKKPWHD